MNDLRILALVVFLPIACGGSAASEPSEEPTSGSDESAPVETTTTTTPASSEDPLGTALDEHDRFVEAREEFDYRHTSLCAGREGFQSTCDALRAESDEIFEASREADRAQDPAGLRAQTNRMLALQPRLDELEQQIADAVAAERE